MTTNDTATNANLTSQPDCAHIVSDMADALIFSDIHGVIRIWNQGAEAVFGYQASEAVGQSLDLIIPESLRAAHWAGFYRAVKLGATTLGRQSIVTRSLHKSGQRIYVDMSFAIVKNSAGEVSGSVAIARDATQRYLNDKALRAQLATLSDKQTG